MFQKGMHITTVWSEEKSIYKRFVSKTKSSTSTNMELDKRRYRSLDPVYMSPLATCLEGCVRDVDHVKALKQTAREEWQEWPHFKDKRNDTRAEKLI